MLKVGLTGNIGSGKTTVARIFQSLGIPVFFADEEAKALYSLPSVHDAVVGIFGRPAYAADGTLDRHFMASKVFGDPDALEKLNSIIHPMVRQRFDAWSNGYFGESFVLYEAAILFESGFYRLMDRTILVTAPEALRIKRIMERDGISEAQLRQRMQHQWPEEQKRPLADFIIDNDEEHMVLPQVLAIHRKLL